VCFQFLFCAKSFTRHKKTQKQKEKSGRELAGRQKNRWSGLGRSQGAAKNTNRVKNTQLGGRYSRKINTRGMASEREMQRTVRGSQNKKKKRITTRGKNRR